MIEWEEIELGSIGKVQTGPFGSQLLNEQYITGGIPIITVEHIKDFRITYQPYPSVTEEDKRRLSRYVMRSGDIIFSRVGSVDLSALVTKTEDGWLFSSRMLCFRPDITKVDATYLAYYLRLPGMRKYINRIAVGSTMPSINTEILKGVPLRLPPLQTQKTIGQTLLALDERMNALRQEHGLLEQFAELVFKQSISGK